jgi:hypothetical protein
MIPLIEELRGQVMDEIGRAALAWDERGIKRAMDTIARLIASAADRGRAELGRLLGEAWRLGIELVDAPVAAETRAYGHTPLRAAEINVGYYHVSEAVLEALKDYSSDYLDNALGDAWRKVRAELNLGILGTKTAQEVAVAVGHNLRDASIFRSIAARAEAITQTEMGRVFSRASQLRMEEAAQYVPGLEKQWVHAGHPKQARPDHLAAHGQHVPTDQPFNVGGIKMMYPRDIEAPISEVIHCGCDMIPWKKEWEDDTAPLDPRPQFSVRKLGQQEQQDIKYWTGTEGFHYIRQAWANPATAKNGQVTQAIADMQKIFSEYAGDYSIDNPVYRGLSMFEGRQNERFNAIWNAEEGAILALDTAPSSWTQDLSRAASWSGYNYDTKRSIVLVFEPGERTTPGYTIAGAAVNPGEQEVLMPPLPRVKVTRKLVDAAAQSETIYLEEVQ